MASMKREKLSIINDDDRISKLPNSLTHYILSFMNTKLAVQTGALSRRWRNLWTSLPYIDFNFNTFPYVVNPSHSESESYKQKRSSFANFITHFLLRRNESGVISFRFSDVDHNVLVEPVVLESILYYAIKHQAQELYVNAFCRKQLELPHIFLDCDSLKVLSLENFCGIFKLPNSLGFLSLTSLILAGFYRFNDNFFASCPNLERLKLVFKSLAKIEDFYINAPNLKILEISTFKNFRQWKFCGSTRLSIFTPNLEYFKFSGGGPFFSFRSELPGVNHVEIDADASFITITEENKMDFGLILIRMLDEFNKAKSITLSLKTAQVSTMVKIAVSILH